MMKKLLILEDDVVLLETLQDEFLEDGYSVDIAKHGEEVLTLSAAHHYDLYIFDVNVPYIDGFTLLKELRETGDETATIFLTSKDEEKSRIKGFETGCDDYLIKPFSLFELKLRVQALLRRATPDSKVIFDDVTIDLDNNLLELDNTSIELEKKALEILHLFVSQPKRLFSLDEIIENIYEDKIPTYTVLRVHISKINALFSTKRIHNVRGQGYRYEK